MIRMFLSAGMVFLLALGTAQVAGDAVAGEAKAARAGCHAAYGQGVPPNPALTGKSGDQILQALKEFKSGKRDSPVMKGLRPGSPIRTWRTWLLTMHRSSKSNAPGAHSRQPTMARPQDAGCGGCRTLATRKT